MKTTMKWAGLVLAFLYLHLLCGCINQRPANPGEQVEPSPIANDVAMAMLRSFPDVVIQTAGTDALLKQKNGAQIITLFDRPTTMKVPGQPDQVLPPDGRLSLAEIEALITASSGEELTARLTFVGIMVYGIIQSQQHAAAPGGGG